MAQRRRREGLVELSLSSSEEDEEGPAVAPPSSMSPATSAAVASSATCSGAVVRPPRPTPPPRPGWRLQGAPPSRDGFGASKLPPPPRPGRPPRPRLRPLGWYDASAWTAPGRLAATAGCPPSKAAAAAPPPRPPPRPPRPPPRRPARPRLAGMPGGGGGMPGGPASMTCACVACGRASTKELDLCCSTAIRFISSLSPPAFLHHALPHPYPGLPGAVYPRHRPGHLHTPPLRPSGRRRVRAGRGLARR